MTQFGNMIRKDALRSWRSPVGVLVQMAIPLAISVIFGLVFSPSGGKATIRFKMALADLDDSFASRFVKSAFTQGDLAKMVDLHETDAETGRDMVARGKASALLTIPKGFQNDLLDGRPVVLKVLKNPAESILPGIAVEVVRSIALMADYGARILNSPLRNISTLGNEGGAFPTEAEWSGVSLSMRGSLEKIHRYAMPPVVKIVTEEKTEAKSPAADFNYFALFLPGMAIMGLLFIADHSLKDLSEELATGRMRRIFTAPVGPGVVLGAKLTYAFLLTFLAFCVMSAVGVLCFGMRPRLPWLYLAGGVAAAAACTGLMAVITCLFSVRGRSEAMSSVIIVVMCMVGGSYFPIDQLPPFFQTLAQVTVNFYSIHLFRGSLDGGIPASGALFDLAILVGIAAVSLVVGVRVLHRRLMEGVSQ